MSEEEENEEGFYTPKRGGDYYKVMGEFIVKEVPEGTEDAVSRVNKEGRTVWEIRKPGYRGKIQSVYINKSKNPKYPDTICIKFKKVTIQMQINGQHAQRFIAKVRSINLNEEIKFEPYRIARTDKKDKFNVGVTLYQNGEKVIDYLDCKKDGDLPELEQKKKAGKIEWDDTKRANFLYEHLTTWIEEQEFPDPRDKSGAEESSEKYDDQEEEEETEGGAIPF